MRALLREMPAACATIISMPKTTAQAVRVKAYPGHNLTTVYSQHLAHEFPLHLHRSLVIGRVCSGIREMLYSDAAFQLGPGQVYLVLPGEIHACRAVSPNRQTYRALCLALPAFHLEEKLRWKDPLQERRAVSTDPKIRGALQRCFRALESPMSYAARQAVLEDLFSDLRARYLLPAEDALTPAVQQVKQVLDESFDDRLTLDGLGRRAAYSKFTVSRRFQQEVGLPPHVYLLQARIRKAQKLLLEGKSVIETAQMLGFHDQSHFTRFFKRFVGIPPAQYKKLNQ